MTNLNSDLPQSLENMMDGKWEEGTPAILSLTPTDILGNTEGGEGSDPGPSPKAALGVAIASVVVEQFLAGVMSNMKAGAQSIVIGLCNYTNHVLEDPVVALWGGLTISTSLGASPEHMAVLQGRNRFGTDGSQGVLTYNISGTQKKLAIMWYIPMIGNNWFKCAVLDCKIPTNKKLFSNMLSERQIVGGRPVMAKNGVAQWGDSELFCKGIMGTDGQAILNAEFRHRPNS